VKKSKHNIFSKIHDSDQYFLVNPLSGNADILSSDEAMEYLQDDFISPADWEAKGYLVDPESEEAFFKKRYLDFIDERDTDEVQLFFVPGYACNFNCNYCYQSEYAPEHADLTTEIIDAFFNYVSKKFSHRKKYITLFGGEPLLSSQRNKELIGYFMERAREYNLEVAVVTNGYTLEEYLPLFSGTVIREIQVTLDGTKTYHDARRKLKNNTGTFDKVVAGIDACLNGGYPVNLRMVVDKENLKNLPEFARFCIDKGWTKSSVFKTQIGRNYELHSCQLKRNTLYTRIDLYKDIYQLLKEYPHIREFHKPAFSVSKFLFENGELPAPVFDACPGTKTEWAFDYTGSIYSCTATVGKTDEKLGSFYPSVSLDEDKIIEWEERDVLSVDACHHCALQLICGAGCGSIAKNKNGNLHSPDCRPVKELLELGISHYNS